MLFQIKTCLQIAPPTSRPQTPRNSLHPNQNKASFVLQTIYTLNMDRIESLCMQSVFESWLMTSDATASRIDKWAFESGRASENSTAPSEHSNWMNESGLDGFIRLFQPPEQRRIGHALDLIARDRKINGSSPLDEGDATDGVIAINGVYSFNAIVALLKYAANNGPALHQFAHATLIRAASDALDSMDACHDLSNSKVEIIHREVGRFVDKRKRDAFDSVFVYPTAAMMDRVGCCDDEQQQRLLLHGANTYLALIEASLRVVGSRRAHLNDAVTGVYPFLDKSAHLNDHEWARLNSHVRDTSKVGQKVPSSLFDPLPSDLRNFEVAHTCLQYAFPEGFASAIDVDGNEIVPQVRPKKPTEVEQKSVFSADGFTHTAGSLARTILNSPTKRKQILPYLQSYMSHFTAKATLEPLWNHLCEAGLIESVLQPIFECMDESTLPQQTSEIEDVANEKSERFVMNIGFTITTHAYTTATHSYMEGQEEDEINDTASVFSSASVPASTMRSRTNSVTETEDDVINNTAPGNGYNPHGTLTESVSAAVEAPMDVKAWVFGAGLHCRTGFRMDRFKKILDFAGVTNPDVDVFADEEEDGFEDEDEEGLEAEGEEDQEEIDQTRDDEVLPLEDEQKETIHAVMKQLVDTLRSIGAYDDINNDENDESEMEVDEWGWNDDGDEDEDESDALKLVL
ncbi:hypothetical protein BJ741DRAFT_640979 [Chytriomyces cf. hyalinus JEL632]|nr:hypothetical protein BJ741DRAFT_640979 [Chytriomyces cf. hyalinus JEL632]